MQKKRTIILAIIISLTSLYALDYYVGSRQNTYLAEKAALKKKLEQLAWYSLRGEIKDVTYAGNKYRVAVKFENAFPEEEMFIMIPQMRCFIQVGWIWKEVPLHDVDSKNVESQVMKLEGSKVVEKLIEVPFKNFEEVLPGYMHVRINVMSYIASNALSKDDIVEKNEDFYIYLKPYYSNNKTMLKKFTFTNNEIPIFIPMPPH
jgi:hypothetical protein